MLAACLGTVEGESGPVTLYFTREKRTGRCYGELTRGTLGVVPLAALDSSHVSGGGTGIRTRG